MPLNRSSLILILISSLSLINFLFLPYQDITNAQEATPTPCRVMPLVCPADAQPAVMGTQPTAEEIVIIFQQQAITSNIPPPLLMAMGQRESEWRQFEAEAGQPGCTVMPRDLNSCDYGLMQINWIHHNTYNFNQIAADYTYNIASGASILNWQWAYRPQVNSGNRANPIHWYTPLWGYNGWSRDNNPMLFERDRDWERDSPNAFPYQEKILYTARETEAIDGDPRWASIGEIMLPDDELFPETSLPLHDILIFNPQAHPFFFAPNCGINHTTITYTLDTTQTVTTQITIRDQPPRTIGATLIKTLPVGVNTWDGTDKAGNPVSEGEYWFTVAVTNTRNQLIGRQSKPVVVACHPLYLLAFLNNHPPIYFSEPFTPIHPAWEFYNNDPDNEIEDYIYLYTTEGQDDNQSLFITEQIGLFSYTSGARLTVAIPNHAPQVFLSFWVRRFGDHGAYRVLVDDQIVVSEENPSVSWQQHTVEVTFATTDGDLNLHFQVPSQLLNQAVLFDNIQIFGQ